MTIAGAGAGVAMAQPRFAPDGAALGFLCDAGGWLNLWCAGPDGDDARPLVAEAHEHGDPAWGPGLRSWAWSPDSRRVVFCRNEEGFGRLCLAEAATGAVQELDRGVYYGLSWAGGPGPGARIAGVRSGARTPDEVVVLDPGAGADRRVTLARGPVAGFSAGAGQPEPEVVAWEGEDVPGLGRAVHGRLWRSSAAAPRGLSPDDPRPLLVWAHGGPTSQTMVVFNARVAYFLARGWNVLHVDHRGSTGWGRAYAQALRGQWGRLDVQDIAAGMRAGAARGWGDPRRMVPIGGSAGGFAVLLLLALHPELCAAGVDLYGVTDLFELNETTHRFEAHYLESLVGALPANAERYRQRSPVTVADRIACPVLVLQGSADKVVPQSQSDALVATLQRRGTVVDYHVYDGEGHGWSRAEVVEDMLERIDTFLRRHVVERRS
ncbi:MAG TPA: prolyl oligopeptidase family serine peptidase [Acidimicrobiales bacterium]|nr:prolyl oligopeptidase family serine peptidase [Acidimicrobiales bacterium]